MTAEATESPGGVSLLRRLVRLYSGLVLFGVSIAALVAAELGLPSWDVLHEGVARSTGVPFGGVVVATGALVLLAWLPLRVRPGLGTLSNVVVVGLVAEVALAVLPRPETLAVRVPLLLGAVVLNGFATGLYIGAGFGPGPRDGLMTGLARRGVSVRAARSAIEVVVLVSGWLLGGTVGFGTVLFAVAIGPLAQFFLRRLHLTERDVPPCTVSSSSPPAHAVSPPAAPSPSGSPDSPGGARSSTPPSSTCEAWPCPSSTSPSTPPKAGTCTGTPRSGAPSSGPRTASSS